MRRVFLAYCALLLFAAAPASAASPPCGDRPIRLAFFEYGLYYSHGEGIDKDLVDALRQRSGCRFEVSVQARARIWKDLRSGALDMATSALETPERDEFVWFEPYLWIKNMAVLPADVGQKVGTPADFLAQPKLMLGVVRGFKHGEELDRWIDLLRRKNRVVEYVDADLLFRNLAAHRVDGAIADALVYRRLLDAATLDRTAIEDWTPGQPGDPVNLVFSKTRFDRATAEEWRGLIRGLIEDGTVAAILRRYLPEVDVERLTTPK